MDIKQASAEDLMYWLGLRLAKDQFEVNQEIYREEAEAHADAGTTESSYMKDGIEGVAWYCNEQVGETVFETAGPEYERLVKEKYNR